MSNHDYYVIVRESGQYSSTEVLVGARLFDDQAEVKEAVGALMRASAIERLVKPEVSQYKTWMRKGGRAATEEEVEAFTAGLPAPSEDRIAAELDRVDEWWEARYRVQRVSLDADLTFPDPDVGEAE